MAVRRESADAGSTAVRSRRAAGDTGTGGDGARPTARRRAAAVARPADGVAPKPAMEQPRARRIGAVGVARVAIGAAAALVIAVAALAVMLVRAGSAEDARSAALSAARTFAVDATTYDYRTVDSDYQAVIDRSTGGFHDRFVGGSADTKAKIQQFQASSIGRIDDAAVRDVLGGTATVLVDLDQQVANTTLQNPRVDHDRLRLTLTDSGGRWLVSKVESL